MDSTIGLVERKTTAYRIVDLPFNDDGSLRISRPDQVCVYIPGHKYPVDVGSWCYTVRSQKSRNRMRADSVLNLVDLDSYIPGRAHFISSYLEHLNQLLCLGKSPGSLKTAVPQFREFVDWCDLHGIEALSSKSDYINAVYCFTEYMIDRVRRSKISINTAAAKQLVVKTVGRNIYSTKSGDLFAGVRRVRRSLAATNITKPPSGEKTEESLKIYYAVFVQLADFVLNFEPFPKKLSLQNDYFWFFPTQMPFAGPSNVAKKTGDNKKFAAYDYVNGRIRTLLELQEIYEKRGSSPKSAKPRHDNAWLQLEKANAERYNAHRMRAASMSYQAFMMLFAANTGMSLGQMANLRWSPDYEIKNERQGFRTVKLRAGGRHVEFFVESAFLKLFYKALELRHYIISGVGQKDYEFLFFSFNGKTIYPLSMNLSTDFHRRLEICFGFQGKITTREWRAHKSDWLLSHTDLRTTAMVLQNTPDSVRKHYAEGTEKRAGEELTEFFGKLKQSLVVESEDDTTPIISGQCVSFANPEALDEKYVKPDCATPEGCLFCAHYRVHADIQDYRKLFSLKYILQQSRHLAKSEAHFTDFITPVVKRIDDLGQVIEANSEAGPEEFRAVRRDIEDNEKLTGYWEKKLRLMDDLGII